MSRDFITLTRDDPDFEKYLLGTFSDTERALPVETYHAQTYRERVTFQIVPRKRAGVPHWTVVYFWSCRPELWALTLGPAVAAWLSHRHATWDRWPSWLALLGIFFLQTAGFLYNDVQDHVRGSDRLNRQRGSQVIQKGWSSAAEMRRWSIVNFVLAIVFGVPAFLNAPLPLAGVCLGAAVALLVLLKGFGRKYGSCDLALVALFGPLLTTGVALASFGEASWRDVGLGLAFGATALWVFQVRQFENLFRSKPAGFRTFIGRLTFERAKWVVVVEGFLLLALHPAAGAFMRASLMFLALLPFASLPSILLMNRVYKAASPLSSTLVDASRWALVSQLAWSLWWSLALGVAWL